MKEVLFHCGFVTPRHAASKNEKKIMVNPKTGKLFLGKHDKTLEAQKWIINNLIRWRLRKRLETISCDVNLRCIFYFPQKVYTTKKGERSKKIPDLENCISTIQDCLTKAKIIVDDTIICGLDGCRREPRLAGNEYYLEIEITRF